MAIPRSVRWWILSIVLLLFSWGCLGKNDILVARLLIKTEHLQSRLEKAENQNARIEKDLHLLTTTNGLLEKRLTSLSEAMTTRKRQQEADWNTVMKYIERLHEKNEKFTQKFIETEPPQEEVEREPLSLSSGAFGRGETQSKHAATETLLHVERLISTIEGKELTKEQDVTFAMIQGFVSKAKEVFDKKEFSKALSLGDKAQTLANELLAVTQK